MRHGQLFCYIVLEYLYFVSRNNFTVYCRCGHCQKLVPEYIKLADALKDIFKVGAVDMTQHQSVGALYNVKGFPTIKIFGANKIVPVDYQG